MESTTICIIDDHKIVRQGLKELLEKMSDYKVISEFDSGTALLQALPPQEVPDLFILDYSMPGMNGVEVIKAMHDYNPDYKILLLTQHFEESIIDAAYHYGARGFLHKNCTAQELRYAIDNIKKIGYNNITEILKRVRNYSLQEPKSDRPAVNLSQRELEFLALVCHESEYTYEQMADIMGLSVKSVEAQRSALFDRFGIRSKVGLVLFSHKYRLTEPFL